MRVSLRKIVLAATVFLAMTVPLAFAAEQTQPAAPVNWIQGLIPVAVPILIFGIKKAFGMLPGWLLPIIAPILGGVADALLAWASGGAANPLLGAVLGSAGVGLREVVDQGKKALIDG